MSNHPLDDYNGNDNNGSADWRQQNPRLLGQQQQNPSEPQVNHHLQQPPTRDCVPPPPPQPQQQPQHPSLVITSSVSSPYSNQAILRQQATNQQSQRPPTYRSPFGDTINIHPIVNNRYNDNTVGAVAGAAGILDPEDHFLGGDDTSTDAFHSSVSGWSEVDPTGGGMPPSARSLHSAALLNGVMYIFGKEPSFAGILFLSRCMRFIATHQFR
jgi:hypothetical protein